MGERCAFEAVAECVAEEQEAFAVELGAALAGCTLLAWKGGTDTLAEHTGIVEEEQTEVGVEAEGAAGMVMVEERYAIANRHAVNISSIETNMRVWYRIAITIVCKQRRLLWICMRRRLLRQRRCWSTRF